MTHTEALIEANNQKREVLTEENKQIYEDFLMYLRTDIRIAEQEAEEVLMDILDHLLDAEKEGKSAPHLFGDDPKAYAEELIAHLPKEKKRHWFGLLGGALAHTLAFLFVLQGILYGVLPFFTEIDQTIALGNTLVTGLYVLVSIPLAIVVLFALIRQSLFKQNQKNSERWVTIKAGVYGMLLFLPLLLFYMLVPDFGPVIEIDWWIYLSVAVVLYLGTKLFKKRRSN
ncbi:DUF1129 family protein [Alkalihalobacillus sp. LMS6]|uniref:DUF1129 family protein n=1 Tax=Alkalihalobacillus sp. LMS6 TaxID=2924034 RepID=UPI0020D15BA2|nr:DUF1129 family protein [Alkalihalobacillus sp. LMS6]UTR06145.1 DUF1129 family protein [Alkalihalobacillus sp. LMS6]